MVKNMPKKYYTRIIENELDQMLGIFGAVLIEGPKWCGKTTTAGTRAASKLFRWMCSRRNAVGEVKLTPQFLDLVSEI